MWYFTWILGISLAAALGILNAMWYEFHAGRYDPGTAEDTNDKNDETAQ